jgi:hypothetical protein
LKSNLVQLGDWRHKANRLLPISLALKGDINGTNSTVPDFDYTDEHNLALKLSSLNLRDLQSEIFVLTGSIGNAMKSFEKLLEPISLLSQKVLRYSKGSSLFAEHDISDLSSISESWTDIQREVIIFRDATIEFTNDQEKLADLCAISLDSIESQIQILINIIFSLVELKEVEFVPSETSSNESGGKKEYNQHAVNIIENVSKKVEGNQMPVDDQVNLLIKQAVDSRMLCQMYEGFMSWI